MTAILLNASLVTDGHGYVRRLQLEFADGKGKTFRHPSDAINLCPGLTRTEVAQAFRLFADKVEHEHHHVHEARLVSSND